MPGPRPKPLRTLLLAALLATASLAAGPAAAQSCSNTVVANVVALDQVFFWNRLGAVQPQGMIFALEHDVVDVSGGTTLSAGNVRLREDKRPRPLVLRMNVGDCLQVNFRNLLAPARVDQHQPAVRKASMHAIGLELRNSIADDGSFVGQNGSSLVDPGGSAVYTWYAAREGQHLVYSAGTTTGGEGDGGQLNTGLFGAVIVEPVGSNWYRSQVTAADLALATTGFNTTTGHPIIDYEARYPTGHAKAGRPILNMRDGTVIVHSDLNAVITYGSPHASFLNPGWFPQGHFPPNVFTHPERRQPFREFVIVYHDEIGAVQAFPIFEQEFNGFSHALHSGRDAFAINYGTGGIGAEILANRFGVGPMFDCEDCKYEEFFLTSWAVGDPAMVVDEPANTDCMITTGDPNGIRASDPTFEAKVDDLRDGGFNQNCLQTGPKATKAFFPDDPSNVYHGYLRDHTRFRVLHGGSKEHHIHHLHAHQWLYTGDSDESTYLDSQAFGPGSGFTMEIAYEGGGNKNLTPGDSIFHCHFYPHFAQGMWALWRVHDVFEAGTVLDANGRPAVESRALPDAEILAGTPIPAVIPLPGKPLAPLPAKVWIANGQVEIEPVANLTARRNAFHAGNFYQQKWNPGFPFYIPGIAGKRPPHPPLDTIHDGGLPRHLIADSNNIDEAHTRLDFHKHLLDALPVWLPEDGTDYEKIAMDFHAVRSHPSCQSDGFCDQAFLANGRPPVPGAPYADPCVEHGGDVPEGMQTLLYKAADIQLDAVLNKDGWHYYQQRITALWEDVDELENRTKPPEPLFFRANSREHCIEYWLANLVPYEYEQDAFQVRTPTDILGQHIHLVKFDVLASDGAANGFNYEDGTFSPDEVLERINAIRARNGCGLIACGPDPIEDPWPPPGGEESLTAAVRPVPTGYPGPDCPVPVPHPKFGVCGAQTTVQRWYPDPVYDNQQNDRTLRTVFTHDHFGPSTHQQAGLYAGLVVEPEGSTWLHNESGAPLGPNPLLAGSNPPQAAGRGDGGPTSWQAVIQAAAGDPNAEENTFREFLLEFQDFALAHEENAPSDNTAINPPARKNAGLQDLLEVSPTCTDGGPTRPCPELISADDVGTMTVNYRNEPLALRLRDPATNGQAAGNAGDLSLAFSSTVDRADNDFDVQPTVYPDLTADLQPGDPFTPLLRAYENDRVQIRILVGAHEEGHNFSIHGIKWLFEPSWDDSGYRGSQMMGISEHFEFIVPHLIKNPSGPAVDRLWSAGSSTDDYWNGIWGLFRAYTGTRQDLHPLPTNPNGRAYLSSGTVGDFDFSCPKEAPVRTFDVTAIDAQQALPNGELVYNPRTDDFPPLFDPTSILYVRSSDLVSTTNGLQLSASAPVEPLILRAAAGECIQLTLRNELPEQLLELDGWNTLPMIVRGFNANDIAPSNRVGLTPQMLYFDPSRDYGHDVGVNNLGLGFSPTIGPGGVRVYEWYAGDVVVNSDGTATPTPIEFGATNLVSSDPMEHASKGAIGALIVEPEGATWVEDPTTRAVADVTNPTPVLGQDGTFREFVLVFQNDVNLRSRYSFQSSNGALDPVFGEPVPNLDANSVTDPEDTGGKALNYRTEPLWKRVSYDPSALGFSDTRDFPDWWDVVANSKVGGDPVTPVFRAEPGDSIRFRLLQPGGHSRNEVFTLHGHVWDQQPYVAGSTRIGRNPLSFWEGARMGHGPTNHFDAVIRHGAGGTFGIEGDYLYRDFVSIGFEYGLWGILRVQPQLVVQGEACGDTVCTGGYECCDPFCGTCVPKGMSCTLGCSGGTLDAATAGEEVLWQE